MCVIRVCAVRNVVWVDAPTLEHLPYHSPAFFRRFTSLLEGYRESNAGECFPTLSLFQCCAVSASLPRRLARALSLSLSVPVTPALSSLHSNHPCRSLFLSASLTRPFRAATALARCLTFPLLFAALSSSFTVCDHCAPADCCGLGSPPPKKLNIAAEYGELYTLLDRRLEAKCSGAQKAVWK